MPTPLVTYVSERLCLTEQSAMMERDLGIKISLMSMKELLVKLTMDPEFQPSLLVFDLMSLDNVAVKIFETSNTIATLSILGGKQHRPVFAVLAFKDSDPLVYRGVFTPSRTNMDRDPARSP